MSNVAHKQLILIAINDDQTFFRLLYWNNRYVRLRGFHAAIVAYYYYYYAGFLIPLFNSLLVNFCELAGTENSTITAAVTYINLRKLLVASTVNLTEITDK